MLFNCWNYMKKGKKLLYRINYPNSNMTRQTTPDQIALGAHAHPVPCCIVGLTLAVRRNR